MGTPNQTTNDQPTTPAAGSLDAVMDTAYKAAMAQAESGEAPVVQDGAGTGQRAEGSPPAEDPGDEPLDDAGEGGGDGQPKPTRREAARLQSELQKIQAERDALKGQVTQYQTREREVQQRYADRLGTPEEVEKLHKTLADPNADWTDIQAARTRLGEMESAREELAPIYQGVLANVLQNFMQGVEVLKDLPGMDEDTHKALSGAKTGPEALKLMWDAGQKAARTEAEGTIASLKAEIKGLRTRAVGGATQPASAGGKSPNPSTPLEGLLKNGIPTDEAIQAAMSGRLIGVDLSKNGAAV